MNLGTLYHDHGKYDEALNFTSEALQLIAIPETNLTRRSA